MKQYESAPVRPVSVRESENDERVTPAKRMLHSAKMVKG